MFIDRRGLKWSARDAMRAARPNAIIMTLVYLLLTAGLSIAVNLLAADPLARMLQLYQQGVTLDRAFPLAVAGVGSVGLFLNILMVVFGVVVNFGYRGWCLNTVRGEQGAMGDLIGGFSMVGRILWLCAQILFYSLLWYIAIVLPAFWCMLFLTFLLGPLGAVFSYFGAALVLLSRVVRYFMAPYCLLDEPEMGASRALRRSRQMMDGHVKDYILLMLLSFLGWYLLGWLILTVVEGVAIILMGGLPLIMERDLGALELIRTSTAMTVTLTLAAWPLRLWLLPYVTMTECKFYERIKTSPSDRPPF